MTPPLVPPPGPQTPLGTPTTSSAPAEGDAFAKVYDLALARARRSSAEPVVPAIPATVLEEMEAASRMFHALRAQGHELRFEQDAGRVRAELRTVDGDVVRDVPLTEAIDAGADPLPAA